ncbi:MAG: DUF1918 domain-containing protein [bacterium]|nr:DUF1918 domain-containing protein [bacterium]
MTKRVGQRSQTGKIVDIRDNSYEIRWEDGHTSISTPEGIVAVKKPKTD